MRLAITISAALVPGVVTAHPDHVSGGDSGITHFLADPFHVALLAAAVLIFLAVRRLTLCRSASFRSR